MKKTAFFLTTLCVTVASAIPAFAWEDNFNCPTNQVPEPATLLMLGGAIAGMFLLKNRFRKEK